MPDLKSEDLGKGYTLCYQQNPTSKQVRAVVKATDGSLVIRGPVVDADKAEISRRTVAIEFATTILQPSQPKFDESDGGTEEDTEDEAEDD